MPGIKQLIVLRRKAGLTCQEFFDYHYQVHGAISTAPNPGETPQYVESPKKKANPRFVGHTLTPP